MAHEKAARGSFNLIWVWFGAFPLISSVYLMKHAKAVILFAWQLESACMLSVVVLLSLKLAVGKCVLLLPL